MTDEQWEAIQHRDASCDGVFYYAVKTTGVVCRPSCPARTCSRKNAVIFNTLEEALHSGYRPCLRCRPELQEWHGARQELARKAEKLIREHCAEKLSLTDLAGALFVNECYLIRAFGSVYGESPMSYQNTCRCKEAARLLLETDQTITQIAYSLGFVSSSHFSRVFRSCMGTTPSAWRRNGGKAVTA